MGYLRQLVEFKNDDGLISRAFDDVSASNNAVAKLKAWFTSMNAFIVCEHKFGRDGARSNVVAFLKGESADAVIVGAHYDSRPFHSEHMPAPGAVDNGSGSAGVLAIAKAFAEAGVKPKNSIYFVLFGGEEAGLLGSDAFVNDLKANKDVCTGASFLQQDAQQLSGGGLTLNRARARGASRRLSAGPIYAAIIMDEVGWKTPRAETYPCLTVNLETFTWSEDIADHLYEASILYNSGQDPHPGCENGLDVIHSTNPFGSDHMSFLSAGIHAVLTIHGDDDYFSSYGYHSSNDKIELIDEPLIANIVRMNGVGALRLGFVDLLPSSLS